MSTVAKRVIFNSAVLELQVLSKAVYSEKSKRVGCMSLPLARRTCNVGHGVGAIAVPNCTMMMLSILRAAGSYITQGASLGWLFEPYLEGFPRYKLKRKE